ncbi:MAG: glycosyltransferase family 39 protein [Propionivibrio sp.]|uniref:ArnT family glycosyltransferase n=1 Tax=Propionivibrio sp. TaxID=2212460 RepID=UPI0025F0D4AB|nr:glycosyltransferase family 39 protein [Propionivibrio sp.]MBL0207008.1 glycosyltransferase family 39 protein [Propionivibrio sp.]
MDNNSFSYRCWLVLIVTLGSLIYLIRLSGPSDLESYAQFMNVGYVLDLMKQGHWIVQHDLEGTIMSKPPLHTWLMAPFTWLFGLNRPALTLPSFLSVVALGLLVFDIGRRRFGELAGGLAALAIVLAPIMAKQITLVRTDPAFTLAVTLAALAAFSAWEGGKEGGKSWLLFWIMAAISTLIKGPLGIVLASGGLLVHFWEKRSTPQQPQFGKAHLPGIALFLALTLGWFFAAWISAGQALIDKMFYSEMYYHAVVEHQGGWRATDLLKPSFFLLLRFLPFSLAFVFALWRVCRKPADDPGERRFERFLTCWLLVGLLIFSLVKHQRADHLLPLWPACALLAGREMARFAERIGKTRFAGMSVVIGIVLIGSTYAAVNANEAKSTTTDNNSAYARELKLATNAKLAADAFLASGLDAKHLYHIDTPMTLQLYLGTYNPYITRERLEEIIVTSSAPVDFALGKTSIEDFGILDRHPDTKRVFRWPSDESEPPVMQVFRAGR